VGTPDSVAEQASRSLGPVVVGQHPHNPVAGDVRTVERQRSLVDQLEDVGSSGQESRKHLRDFGMTCNKREEEKIAEKVTANVSNFRCDHAPVAEEEKIRWFISGHKKK
jgi:hypothetical protein